MNIKDLDNLPKFTYHPTNTSLIDRLKAEKCELCGAVDKLVMHHVRKLKNLQGKTTCEKQMMARKRKTIAICGKCYKNSVTMDRLILLVESRIRGDVYVRFGGELPKTHRSNTAGRWMLSLPLKKYTILSRAERKYRKAS